MTGTYNFLEELRRGEALSAKEREIHEQGLAVVLAQLHGEHDATVLEAYGWQDLAPALVGTPGGTTPCKSSGAPRGQLPGFGEIISGEPEQLGQNQATVPLEAVPLEATDSFDA